MASVTSLDKDLRSMRLSRYTPQAAAEVRDWIEEVLQERLPGNDLLDALKDGVALCRLVNLAVDPGVKFKKSSMPFVQMENISHFLRACQTPPLSLPPHDVFLTVDLYEGKDPAQVLQCIASFSRRANALQPIKFGRSIGVQNKGGAVSPHLTGSSQGAFTPKRGPSANSSNSGPSSPGKSPSAVSSWSKRSDQSSTMPAWNIHQYGYMGGASQANQGVAFGARRQITTAAPHVPSLQEKENRRREEEEQLRLEKEEDERKRRQERDAEEERAKEEEERKWQAETTRLREKERLEEERRRWDEEQQRWEEEERRRNYEEKRVEESLDKERQRKRGTSDARLNGQFLSQYQATQTGAAEVPDSESQESQRVKELEQELEHAKARERRYELERQDIQEKKAAENRNRKPAVPVKPSYDLSSLEQERRMLRQEWHDHQNEEPEIETPPPMPPRPLPEPKSSASASEMPPPMPPRPLPEPSDPWDETPPPMPRRPLPDPTAYMNQNRENRTDRFLASNRPPVAPKPAAHRPQDYSTTSEVDAENSRRAAAQEKTRAGGWASKSLLEREMERERERQQEWEEGQKKTQEAAARGLKDGTLGSGPGQSWDVHQYGYMGGDNQNRGGHGLGIGGARRQIIGPRPPP